MFHNRVYGRAFLTLFALLCIASICLLGSGCGRRNDGGQAASAKARDTMLLVFIDKSQSIVGYQRGGLSGIREDYLTVSQGYIKPILQKRNDVFVEARAFVAQEIVLFSRTVDKWEQVRGPLQAEIAKEPYSSGEFSRTYFSSLIESVQNTCKQYPSRDIYVLVLTDGHPDEPFEKIREVADKFAAVKPANLKSLLVAPVQPDMSRRWRENLTDALSPLCAYVANESDFRTAAEAAQTGLGGE